MADPQSYNPHSFTEKPTPADADEFYGQESPFSAGSEFRVSLVNFWTNYVKPKTDALYEVLGAGGATTIDELSDVAITSLTDGDVLVAQSGSFVNLTLTDAGIAALSHTHAASDITSGTLDDARVAESNVTQHQAALSITQSQISDLASYQPLDTDLTAIAAQTTDAAGRSVLNLTNPGADRIGFWDASAGAFAWLSLGANLSIVGTVISATGGSGGGLTEIVEDTTPQLGGNLDLNGFQINGMVIGTNIQAYDADLAAIAAQTNTSAGLTALTMADPGADRIVMWDDSASSFKPAALADMTTESAPASGDFFLAMRAEGDFVIVPHDNLPGGGDANAIHDNVAGEINAITAKLTLHEDDEFILEDSEESYAKKKTTYGDIASDVTEVSFSTKTTTDAADLTLRLDPDNVDPNLRYYAQTEANRLAQLDARYQAIDADTLKADAGDTLTAGFLSDSYSGGTLTTGTYTPAPATGQENFQHITNGGAFTLAPPASPCVVVLEITNNASAGAITTSGFTQVDGDSFTTTDGHDFMCFITKTANFSYLSVKALQ